MNRTCRSCLYLNRSQAGKIPRLGYFLLIGILPIGENMKIRAKTFEHWLTRRFCRRELKDMLDHGVNGGWEGLTYYKDTTALYAKFKEEIWEHIIEESEMMGCSNPFAYLATLPIADWTNNVVTMENRLVWYMAESMAWRILNQ
jgi:hypothetical protein